MGSYARRSYVSNYHNPMMPPAVKWLLIINTALFVAYFFSIPLGFDSWFRPFMLHPRQLLMQFKLWQPVTYLFLHDPHGFGHILMNMLALWWFGKDLEAVWGKRQFLQYYFFCGVGAGLFAVAMSLAFGSLDTPTLGASGAIYGILLAFGLLFPDVQVLLILFPIPAKYFVMIVGAIAFMSTFGSTGGNVSHVSHLGGMLLGFVYLKRGWGKWDFLATAQMRYRDWKLARAKRKFQVYMRKHDRGAGPTIH
ncbi:MAG: rhomboid family intramembrane serine protease [Bryobacterales bacterium]|nr:rhomboid family intramembrane serine protease [Bryobacterales bacterium]